MKNLTFQTSSKMNTKLFLPNFPNAWMQILEEEFSKPYFLQLQAFIANERLGNVPIYPASDLVFNAFQHTPPESVKVVIIGQDPYHGADQAHGLSFSVLPGVPLPPSLRNIFKELQSDVGFTPPAHGCLTKWANQGVLLLNATLTVRQGAPLSHQGKGWEHFTDSVIAKLLQRDNPIIFVLWGKWAEGKFHNNPFYPLHQKHFVLSAPHPSPFSAHSGFFGCRHFSKINAQLIANGLPPIDWQL